MGLGLRGIAKVKAGLFGLTKGNVIDKLYAIAKQGEIFAERHGIRSFYRSELFNNILYVSFHSAEEDIEFTPKEQTIVVSAKTSSLGPGYHAFLVDWLDHLADTAGLNWDFEDDGSGDYQDGTGHYYHRDFDRLQDEMKCHLGTLAEWVLDSDYEHFNLSMPIGFNMEAPYFAANSMGYWDRDFFETPDPERFFPWWQQGVTADTLRNLVMAKMWTDVGWHPPLNETEAQSLKDLLALAERATKRGSPVPHEPLDDMKKLLGDNMLPDVDDVRRIGFRRQLMRWPRAGGWSLVLPGYFYEELNDERTTATLWYDNRAVHVTTLAFNNPLSQMEWPEHGKGEEWLRFETEKFRVVAYLSSGDDDGKPFRRLYGICQSLTGKALISVVIDNDADLPWAEAVLRSVDMKAPVLNPDHAEAPQPTLL